MQWSHHVQLVVSMLLGVALAACADPLRPLACDQSSGPSIVTGLSGTLDGSEPIVEVLLLENETCAPLGHSYMAWDEGTDTVSLVSAPTSGMLSTAGLETTDSSIYFRDLTIGVRLEYPDDAIAGDALDLFWFGTAGDLAHVACVAEGEALVCTVVGS